MNEVITILFTNQLPVALVILGVICVAIAIIGQIPSVKLQRRRAYALGGFGALLILAAIGVSVVLASSTAQPPQASFATPTLPADTKCQAEEKGAIIAGTPVLVTDWKADCAYSLKLQGGETVRLTTWGIILTYAGETIISTRIIPPDVEVTVPANSALFAGYRTREGVEQAYRGKNPNAPTPAP